MMPWLGRDRMFDPLRSDPRFTALLRKLRLYTTPVDRGPRTWNCGLRTVDGGLLCQARDDDHRQANDECREHQCQKRGGIRRRVLELLPDEDAPQGGYEGGSLPESIRNREPCRAGGDDAERPPPIPDDGAEDAAQVQARPG